jgi:hypothetical protein
MKVLGSGFVSNLPRGWEDRSLITLVGPTSYGGFAANVIIARERAGPGFTMEESARRQLDALENEVGSVNIVYERPTSINGATALERLQRFHAEGREIEQLQTFIVNDGMLFTVICTAESDEFVRHREAFRSVIESFHCYDPETTSVLTWSRRKGA